MTGDMAAKAAAANAPQAAEAGGEDVQRLIQDYTGELKARRSGG